MKRKMRRNKYYSIPDAIKELGLREVINHPGQWYTLEDERVDKIYLSLPCDPEYIHFYSRSEDGLMTISQVKADCIKLREDLYIFSDSTKTEILRCMNEGKKFITPFDEDNKKYHKPYPFAYVVR